MPGMRLVFVNRVFYPDHSATSQILTDLCFALAARGHEIHVVTSRLLYDDPSLALSANEMASGVAVHRVWTSRFGRETLLKRAIDYLTFYLSALWRLLLLADRSTVLVVKTDPPMISVVAALAARATDARLVNWTQDLFPEVAVAVGIRAMRPALARWLAAVRDWSLRRAVRNVVIGEHMRARLLARGLADAKIAVIHNWADGEVIVPEAYARGGMGMPPYGIGASSSGVVRQSLADESSDVGRQSFADDGSDAGVHRGMEANSSGVGRQSLADESSDVGRQSFADDGSDVGVHRGMEASSSGVGRQSLADDGMETNPLRREWGLDGKFVVGYSGNLGRVHEFATVLDAAVQLADREDIVFLFIGGGHQLGALKAEAGRRGLVNVQFQPYQPRERLAQSLGACDAHLVTLRSGLEGLVVPSKFYGIIAAGRPVLFVGAADGEIAGLVHEGQCGQAFQVGDAQALAQCLRGLADGPARAREWGENARRLFDARFAMPIAVDRWERVLAGVAQG